jgi:hypothetical protein
MANFPSKGANKQIKLRYWIFHFEGHAVRKAGVPAVPKSKAQAPGSGFPPRLGVSGFTGMMFSSFWRSMEISRAIREAISADIPSARRTYSSSLRWSRSSNSTSSALAFLHQQRLGLVDERRDRQGQEAQDDPQEAGEHQGDAQSPVDAPPLEPPDPGADRADEDQGRHQHQDHRQQLGQEPQAEQDKNQDQDGPGGYFNAQPLGRCRPGGRCCGFLRSRHGVGPEIHRKLVDMGGTRGPPGTGGR